MAKKIDKSGLVTVMIESPKGSPLKYDYKPALKGIMLSKILPAGLVFPFDFGFIPKTKGEDGDPLDIIVICEAGSFPGCMMECRLIGVIKAEQTERNGDKMRNDRFLGIPKVSQMFAGVNEISQLPEAIVGQIEAFFQNYNHQAGKEFKVIDLLSADQAIDLLIKG